jgi:hypothetical protein
MGEAKRRAVLREAMQAAFVLGGVDALKELLRPGAVERCPLCEDGYVEVYREIAGANERRACGMCDGKRYIRRTEPTGDFAYDQDRFRDTVVGCYGGWWRP